MPPRINMSANKGHNLTAIKAIPRDPSWSATWSGVWNYRYRCLLVYVSPRIREYLSNNNNPNNTYHNNTYLITISNEGVEYSVSFYAVSFSICLRLLLMSVVACYKERFKCFSSNLRRWQHFCRVCVIIHNAKVSDILSV